MMKNKSPFLQDMGSFRDPSGIVFCYEGKIYRQVNKTAANDYSSLMNSDLYNELTEKGLLIKHEEINSPINFGDKANLIIQPERIPFISYPYEWSFSQIQDAALLTLQVLESALSYGMILKDASAFNIQFLKGKPIFIDTLSFEKYHKGSPWKAYKQFCEHFLGPLLLMQYCDVRYGRILQIFIDGVPLDFIRKTLPLKSWFSLSTVIHIHLHTRTQIKYSDSRNKVKIHPISEAGLRGIIQSLKKSVKNCKWNPHSYEWVDYYDETNYSELAFNHKKRIVKKFIEKTKPSVIWDIGANRGIFSQIGIESGADVISFDQDADCIEHLYRDYRDGKTGALPLIQDITTPSPDIGWNLKERLSIQKRGSADMVMALALIHHLTISNNVPFALIADYFSNLCRTYLIIEFIPKEDSQVQRLLLHREDVFSDYNQLNFENCFQKFFLCMEKIQITDSMRTLYLMKRNE